MRLVVDTNILFTQFWRNSFTKKLFINKNLELYSPEFALSEIKIHMDEIINKTKISKEEFNELRKELALLIKFIPLEDYLSFLSRCLKLIKDQDDIDFLALAMKLDCRIWSNDPHLKEQNKVKVFTTEELYECLIY